MRSCHTRCYDARCAHELCAICRAVSALRPLRSLRRLASPPRPGSSESVTGKARRTGSEHSAGVGASKDWFAFRAPSFPAGMLACGGR